MVSPRPIWTSRAERNNGWAPSCQAPTSNDTRVRVDDFVKIIANDLPASGRRVYSPRRIRSARANRASSSGFEKSGITRKSRCGEVASAAAGDAELAGTVVVAIGGTVKCERRKVESGGESGQPVNDDRLTLGRILGS